MKISDAEVYGFRSALIGMRQARDSVAQMDTRFGVVDWAAQQPAIDRASWPGLICVPEQPVFGELDRILMNKLVNAGTEHRKFLRAIQVWVTLTLPRYIWVDLDTYKVGTVRLSQSSRHTPKRRPMERDDFQDRMISDHQLGLLNRLRDVWIDPEIKGEKKRDAMRVFKAHLPESYLQTSLYCCNYEVLLTIYRQRRNHPLTEFHELCNWITYLPLMPMFLTTLGLAEF